MRFAPVAFLVCALLASSSTACRIIPGGNARAPGAVVEEFSLTGKCRQKRLLKNLECACGVLQSLGSLSPLTRKLCLQLFPPPRVWLRACSKKVLALLKKLRVRRKISLRRLSVLRFLLNASSSCFTSFATPTPSRSPRPPFIVPRVGSVVSERTPNYLDNSELDTEVSLEVAGTAIRQANEDVLGGVEKCAKCLTCLKLDLCSVK